MEAAVIKLERRGRKRRSKDVSNALADPQTKKRAVETRSTTALVGRYVMKEFKDSGIFLGKIVFYESGIYRVDYEDGDGEDLERGEVRRFLIGDDAFEDDMIARKKKLDELLSKKDVKMNTVEALSQLSNNGANEIDGVQVDGDPGSSSDSCEDDWDWDSSSEVAASPVPPPQLPPSSGNIGVPVEFVSHLFSVYSFLRSFSIRLFLSPFALDDFVGSLNCPVPNTLLDAIHVALMRALRRHLEMLSADGSELASKCLRCIDWSLLDTLTWPVYLVQYLMVMGYTKGTEWKGYYIDVLERDYYALSAGRKLIILQILCDDVLESAELRAEIDMREESEVGVDSDVVTTCAPKSGPRRVHPRYSKTSACKDQEAMEIIEESDEMKSSCNSSSLGYKCNEPVADAGVDQDGNGDECWLCGMDGTLLCCDGCPSAYHSRCIGVSKMFIPEGAWYCPECTISKIGPTIAKGTSLRGAEVFGVDLYGQVFLGTCNHLLVLKVSINSEPSLRYYSQNDIPKVLQALYLSVEHIASYLGICKAILQYWEIPEDVLSHLGRVEIGLNLVKKKEDGKCSTPSLILLGREGHKVLDMVEGENFTSCVTESGVENVAVSSLGNCCKEPGFNNSSFDTMSRTDHPEQRNNDVMARQVCPLMDTKFPEKIKVELTMSAGSVSQHAGLPDSMHRSLAEKSSVIKFAPCTSVNSNGSYKGNVSGMHVAPNMSLQSKEGNDPVSQRGEKILADDHLSMGSLFKPQAYMNHYFHGDFAASAAANLAILSSEENQVSESHALNNRRKVMSANISLQVKAFSSAATRFFWPGFEKKLVEVPRERCGWCLSCKAPVTSKKGCLLNAAASNAIKGAMKILSGLRPVKNGEGSLPGIATYVIFMEESLCGLTVGPFLSATYRRQWREQVERAMTYSAIKNLLLELEENIRVIALSDDWVKPGEDWSVESSSTQTATFAGGSTQKRGPSGRRRRKQSSMPEVTTDDCHKNMRDFIWWRGGMLSKLIYQKGILPHLLVKKAARQGGSKKIPGIYYGEGYEVPKRSRQFVWRAAVEMSRNASQLALQVRYLDLHVRWSDIVRPEQNLQDGKGPETEASAFRNAFICEKKIMESKIRYGVAFGNQKHLPSRVMKNIIEVEQSQDGKDKYWFSETHIPLYLIKEYEENVEKMLPLLADKPMNVLSKLQRRQLKASRKDTFSYLSLKRDKLDKCSCASCQLDVLLRNAVKCNACQGYCHDQCTISSTVHLNEEVEFLIICKQCHHTKASHSK
ncbi:hypothetical protein F0562_001926 [Nyssa sinensis]|uniref:PHD-type domain-containing protein n=1 Tax=Nyssa sinensis TaxID=561372 RepID=A0A5J5C8D8_9ASTE|nr:hypothetical protein F0562_001926 [Nyssa sinensis]